MKLIPCGHLPSFDVRDDRTLRGERRRQHHVCRAHQLDDPWMHNTRSDTMFTPARAYLGKRAGLQSWLDQLILGNDPLYSFADQGWSL